MRFKIHNTATKEEVKCYLDKCKVGVTYTVEIKRQFNQRTISQNRLYRLYVACIADETGNDTETIHTYLKLKFLPVKEAYICGELIKNTTSTTELNTKQFTEFVDKIVVWAATELGIALPDPQDLIFEQFYGQYKDYA